MNPEDIAESWQRREASQQPSHYVAQTIQQAGAWCDEGGDNESPYDMSLDLPNAENLQANLSHTTKRFRHSPSPTLRDGQSEPYECVPRCRELSESSSLAVSRAASPDSLNHERKPEQVKDTSGMATSISTLGLERKDSPDPPSPSENDSSRSSEGDGSADRANHHLRSSSPPTVSVGQSEGFRTKEKLRSMNRPRFRCKSAPCNDEVYDHEEFADRHCLEEGHEAFMAIEAGTRVAVADDEGKASTV